MGDGDFKLPVHGLIQEPQLIFHPERSEDAHVHPLKGLEQFGPYSSSLISKVMDPIRIAFVVPYGTRKVVGPLLDEIRTSHQPRERHDYLPKFPGFSNVFGVHIVPSTQNAWLELPAEIDEKIDSSERPHLVLAEHLTQAVSSLRAVRTEFDVVLIYFPVRWKACFYGGEDENFDLHDHVKAVTATLGIPTQIIRQDSVLEYHCRASVMWRLGIAFYAKAGGVPWKLAHSNPDTAYIGLSYALRSTSSSAARFVTCCSQVFDADGAGLEFLTYDTEDAHIERGNPFLSRGEMRRVMARSLSLYQRRHGGRVPKRVVIHKSTEFKKEEIRGCFDAWKSAEGLELIQVQRDVKWRGILIEEPPQGRRKGRPAAFPCQRGSYMQLGGREVLLWTQGNAPSVVGGRNFYKEGKGIPRPLLLRRFAGHGGWDRGCREVLGLTKMDWNNDALYNRMPVTIDYAKVLAGIVKRVPSLASREYELRYFM